MKMKWCSFFALGFAMMFAEVTNATMLPTPVVHLELNGDLTNSGAGGSQYDGVIEIIGSQGGTPAFVTGQYGQGLAINPDMTYPGGTGAVPINNGNDVAIPYTLPDEGTIAMWYNFQSPHYNYTGIFNNSSDGDQWEGWAESWTRTIDGVSGHCFGARAGGYYNQSMYHLYSDGWQHLALTWDRNDADPTKCDFTVYYNGATHSGARLTNKGWDAPGDTFYLGGNHGNSCGNGVWDDVRIYDVCLTDNQVAAIMSVPEPSTLVLLLSAIGFFFIRKRGK